MIKYLIILIFGFYFTTFSQDSLYFVIRVDDIQSRNTTTLPRSIKDFQNAVMQRGGKVSWGVIPHRLIESQNLDGVLSRELKESITFGNDIFLHGYTHICTLCNQSSHEMYCNSKNQSINYTLQKQLLNDGLKILKDSVGFVPKCFVAPGHQADTITYRALKDLGFEFISTPTLSTGFINPSIFNLASHNEFTWPLTSSNFNIQLNNAISDIKNVMSNKGYYCLLLHDPFIRAGYENGLVINWISKLLDSLNNYYGSKLIYSTITQAANLIKNKITDVNSNNYVINDFSISNNYPNPFNGNTRFIIEKPGYGELHVSLIDIKGEEVRKLSFINLNQGKHIININFSDYNLPTGVYLLRFSEGKNSILKKIIYLK